MFGRVLDVVKAARVLVQMWVLLIDVHLDHLLLLRKADADSNKAPVKESLSQRAQKYQHVKITYIHVGTMPPGGMTHGSAAS